MPSGATEVVAEGAMQVSVAVWMALIIFWVLSPIAGFYLFKVTRRQSFHLDTLSLLTMAVGAFVVVFALTLLTLLQLTQIDGVTALLISALSALVVVVICAFAIGQWASRSRKKAQATAAEHAFRVWDEDQRTKAKNLRKKRY